jgi:hypothetical protein
VKQFGQVRVLAFKESNELLALRGRYLMGFFVEKLCASDKNRTSKMAKIIC